MPSLTAKDRISLCLFTFDDGRRCRTPRTSSNPHFCFYHAQKEAQVRATERISEDLSYFFSSDYLSANDLNTALSRVFVAVARGDLKPRAARTLAYLAQTMFQTLHLAQNEFITACGEKDWRDTIVESISANHARRFPGTSQPAEPATPQSQTPSQPPTPFQPQAPPPAPQPISPVGAGLVHTEPRSARPDSPTPQPEPPVKQPDSQPIAAPNPPATQTPKPPRSTIQTPDPYAVRYGTEYRLTVDGKPW